MFDIKLSDNFLLNWKHYYLYLQLIESLGSGITFQEEMCSIGPRI